MFVNCLIASVVAQFTCISQAGSCFFCETCRTLCARYSVHVHVLPPKKHTHMWCVYLHPRVFLFLLACRTPNCFLVFSVCTLCLLPSLPDPRNLLTGTHIFCAPRVTQALTLSLVNKVEARVKPQLSHLHTHRYLLAFTHHHWFIRA